MKIQNEGDSHSGLLWNLSRSIINPDEPLTEVWRDVTFRSSSLWFCAAASWRAAASADGPFWRRNVSSYLIWQEHLWTFIEPFSPDASFWSVLIETLWSWTQWRIRNVPEGPRGSRRPSVIWLGFSTCVSYHFLPVQAEPVHTDLNYKHRLKPSRNLLLNSFSLRKVRQTDRQTSAPYVDVTWRHVFNHILDFKWIQHSLKNHLHIFIDIYCMFYVCMYSIFLVDFHV